MKTRPQPLLRPRLLKLIYWASEDNSSEVSRLQGGRTIAKGSCLRRLRPFLDAEGLLRVGGRLHFSPQSFSERHPVIVPKGSHVVELLTRGAAAGAYPTPAILLDHTCEEPSSASHPSWKSRSHDGRTTIPAEVVSGAHNWSAVGSRRPHESRTLQTPSTTLTRPFSNVIPLSIQSTDVADSVDTAVTAGGAQLSTPDVAKAGGASLLLHAQHEETHED